MVSSLTLKSLIHYSFVYGVRKYSDFINLHVAVQQPLIEETVFSPLYIPASFTID